MHLCVGDHPSTCIVATPSTSTSIHTTYAIPLQNEVLKRQPSWVHMPLNRLTLRTGLTRCRDEIFATKRQENVNFLIQDLGLYFPGRCLNQNILPRPCKNSGCSIRKSCWRQGTLRIWPSATAAHLVTAADEMLQVAAADHLGIFLANLSAYTRPGHILLSCPWCRALFSALHRLEYTSVEIDSPSQPAPILALHDMEDGLCDAR
ncbi:hypothetical protein C8R45DRAFT_986578 [Mycena sanguinolenta]|nr:hypothetical protein C8R45DRAFT_986578 [Mycena sanguinolenta]